MGIDLWKHILSPLNIWNTSSDMGHNIMELTLTLYHVFKTLFADRYTGPIMYFDWRVSAYVSPFSQVVNFDAAISLWNLKSKHRRNVSLLGKRGQTRVEWEYKSSISWTYLCSGDFK